MDNIVHQKTHKGLTVKIIQDIDGTETPDQCGDDSLFLVHYHRDFQVENENITSDELAAWYRGEPNDNLKAIEKRWKIYPVAAYIHSGVVLSLGQGRHFPDQSWDVSHVGAVLVEKKDWKTEKKRRAAAESLVKEWNYHLSGEVYGYVVETPEGEQLDSCWGFVGEMEYCLKEAKENADYHAEDQKILKRASFAGI